MDKFKKFNLDVLEIINILKSIPVNSIVEFGDKEVGKVFVLKLIEIKSFDKQRKVSEGKSIAALRLANMILKEQRKVVK